MEISKHSCLLYKTERLKYFYLSDICVCVFKWMTSQLKGKRAFVSLESLDLLVFKGFFFLKFNNHRRQRLHQGGNTIIIIIKNNCSHSLKVTSVDIFHGTSTVQIIDRPCETLWNPFLCWGLYCTHYAAP